MNKLVSKRPILRFKQGRKILKGQYGLKPHEILGAGVGGQKVAYVNIPGKGYVAVDAKGNAYITRNEGSNGQFYKKTQFVPIKLTNYDRYHIYKAATRKGGMTGYGTIQSIADYWGQRRVADPNAVTTKQKVVNNKVTGGSNAAPGKAGGGNGKATPVVAGTSFRDAFNAARNSGQQFFTWNNEKFTTQNKGEENYTFQNGKWVDPKSMITFELPENAMTLGTPKEDNITNKTGVDGTVYSNEYARDVFDSHPINNDVPTYTPNLTFSQPTITTNFASQQFSIPRQYPTYTYVPHSQDLQNTFTPKAFTLFSKRGGSLTSRNPVKRFKLNFR